MKLRQRAIGLSENALVKVALHGAHERFEEAGYPGLADMAFEQAGVRPVYLAEQRPEFHDWRERLRTESGLVIANHPGAIDIPAVLKALDRKDVYFIAAERNIERMKGIIDEGHMLPAVSDIGQLRAVLRRVGEVLDQGGVVFLFPSGGIERLGKPFEFKGGFGHLLKSLKPEQMVYAFRIDPEDVQNIFPGALRGLQVATAMIAGKMGLKKPPSQWPTVRIDERYTTADMWQKSLQRVPGSGATKNERLTQQYTALFKKGS